MNVLMTVNTYVHGSGRCASCARRGPSAIRSSWVMADSDSPPSSSSGARRWPRRRLLRHFLRIMSDDLDPDAEETRDERFEFGLDCVLDGIAAKVASRQA